MNVRSWIRRMSNSFPTVASPTHVLGDFQANERISPKRGPLLLVDGLMDQTPHTTFEDMPISRLYPLFTRVGVSSVCVVSRDGAFKGIITRQELMCPRKMDPCEAQ